jgi:hypothetical protein
MNGTSYYTRSRWPSGCRRCHKNIDAGTRVVCTPTEETKTQYAHPTCATPEQIAEADANYRANVAALFPD